MIKLAITPMLKLGNTSIKTYLILFFLICTLSFLFAEDAIPVLSSTEKAQVIDSLATNMAKNYVFEDVGNKVAAFLRDNLKSGVYDKFKDAYQFAEQLTKDISSINNDKHLRVFYDPKQVSKDDSNTKIDEKTQKAIQKQRKISNYGFEEARILDGNIGYLKLNSFDGSEEAYKVAVGVMAFLSNCDALIIDVRENGGGDPRLVQLLISYFYKENEEIHFNDFYVRKTNDYKQYWAMPHCPGIRKPDMEIYVLTSNYTFSCAEEFAYDLKTLKRATIVGDITGGGAHPVDFYTLNQNFSASIPFGRAVNPVTKTNWEGKGVEPDIKVKSTMALDTAYKTALVKIIAKEDDEKLKSRYQWALDGLDAASTTVRLTEKQQNSYTGVYGVRTITLDKGELYYQREGRDKLKMIPMTQDYFRFDEVDYFRLKVIVKDGKAIKLEGHYNDGRIDYNDRTK